MNDTGCINADMERDFDLFRPAVEHFNMILDSTPDLVTNGQQFEDR
jgi:hypothetical protein